jgi:large subunit ribosomal protein L5
MTRQKNSAVVLEEKKANPMRSVFIEKAIVSAGATADNLVKAKKLLEFVTSKKAQIITTSKRIPDFNVRPGLEVGTRVTLRGKDTLDLLRRLLGAIENRMSKKQVSQNHVSFGIEEYIEIPGIEYRRDIGIRGFNTTIVFARRGLRVKRKKIKSGNIPQKQYVTSEDIINYMEEHFKTKFS